MIVADTSVLIPWAAGAATPKTELLNTHLATATLFVVPVTIAELMSARVLTPEIEALADALAVLELKQGYWTRVGLLRGRCLAAGRRARLADTMIAQACLDSGLPLLTEDSDFSVFSELAGLELVGSH